MPPTRERRRFHTNSKKNKKVRAAPRGPARLLTQPQLPETADDFLSAGIEYEESGDRWRPGDKPKAGRFYQRAIDAYTSALALDARAFDAAYNKYVSRRRPEYLR